MRKLQTIATIMIIFFYSPMLLANELILDGTTKETFERSMEVMVSSLSDADKEVFSTGFMSLVIDKYPPAKGLSNFFEVMALLPAAVESAHIHLNGLTLNDFMEAGRRKLVEKEAEKEESARQAELKKQDICHDNGSSKILKVSKWNLELVKSDYLVSKSPKVTVTLENVSDRAIRLVDASVFFHDVLDKNSSRIGVESSLRLKPGMLHKGTGTYPGASDLIQLAKLHRDDVRVFACTKAVVYSDGTKQKF